MLTAPIDTTLQRIIETLDRLVLPEVSSPYARGQVAGILFVLHNLLGKVEEKCESLQEENEPLRRLVVLALEAAEEGLFETEEGGLKEELQWHLCREHVSGQPALEENRSLKGLLVKLIRNLERRPERELGKVGEHLRKEIRAHLRSQMDRELAATSIAFFGKMSKGG